MLNNDIKMTDYRKNSVPLRDVLTDLAIPFIDKYPSKDSALWATILNPLGSSSPGKVL